MTSRINRKAELWCFSLMATVALTLLAISGCSSTSKSGMAESAGSGGSAGSAAHIDVTCIADRIEKSTESFHYSYKYSGPSGAEDREADITPTNMNITITDGTGSHSYRGIRSNEESWGSTFLALWTLRITGLAGRLAGLEGTSAVTSQGAEAMNGYQTTKYSIDTKNANSSDQRQFEMLFGAGSSEKGTVWMVADGCAAKLVLDEDLAQTNGSVLKSHYEISRSK
jgi:hypothetical protein